MSDHRRRGAGALGRCSASRSTATGSLALSLAFFVAVVVWFGRSVQDFFGQLGRRRSCRRSPARPIDDANDRMRAPALDLHASSRDEPSDQYPRDVVMGQQPAQRDARARRPGDLARGQHRRPHLPDARSALRVAAQRAACSSGNVKLNSAGTQTVPNDDVPANYVVAAGPAAADQRARRHGGDADAEQRAAGRTSRCRTSST